MRFHARHIGSGIWGIWDGGTMSWRATDLSEDAAHQQAADLNVIHNQYGQREQADRLEVKPPIEVELATWSAAGKLDYWVKEEREVTVCLRRDLAHASVTGQERHRRVAVRAAVNPTLSNLCLISSKRWATRCGKSCARASTTVQAGQSKAGG